MKRYIRNIGSVALTLLFVAFTLCAVEVQAADAVTTAEASMADGIKAYADKDYAAAVDSFERVALLGYADADLYYNLANAYFKLGQTRLSASGRTFVDGELGRAVLNYRRALRLDPAMEDARYNLDIAVDHTNDTETIPASFIVGLWHSIGDQATANGWTIFSVVDFIVLLVAILFYLLSQSVVLRKLTFVIAIISLLFFVLSTAFALSQRAKLQDRGQAVVVCNDTTPVHASPDSASKVIRQPSQGVTVELLRAHGEWTEILFSDGEKGWIRSSVIEIV
ncbi:MAG: SH3 domain-containing protein [Alistipes sp.]|nr:SH3 domain-containing protein [Alistipes sp.]